MKQIAAVRPDDPMMSPVQHNLLFRTRRGIAVALAVADVFARQTELESLQSRNTCLRRSQGDEAVRFKTLVNAAAYVAAFTLSAYLLQMLDGGTEPVNDPDEPDFLFDTAQDAVKSLVAGLAKAIDGAADETTMLQRAKAFARVSVDGLLESAGPVHRSRHFRGYDHIRIEADDFTINGFDVAPGQRRKPLVMQFKKPNEIIGNHIAKYQATKLAKMLVAYDFDRQLQSLRGSRRLPVHLHRRRRARHRQDDS